jgi:hypothetical protein
MKILLAAARTYVHRSISMSDQLVNRRGSIRKRPRGWVKFEARGKFGMGPNIAHTVWDLSQTGICLVVKTDVKPGEELELRITSQAHHNILTRGTVVWVDPLDEQQYTVGLRFNQPLHYAEVSQLTG